MKLILACLLFVISIISIYGQDALVWKFSTKEGIYSTPTIDENIIYFGCNDSCLYVLNKNTGNLIWKFITNGEIRSKPLICNENVVVVSTDGLIYSLNKKDGTLSWTFKTKGEKQYDMWDYYTSSPVHYKNKIIVGSGDNCIYALNSNTGELNWKFETGDIVHATPVIKDEKVLVGSFDGFFYALDFETGNLVWKFKTVGDAYFPKGEIPKGATLYKNSVIFGSRDYNIYALDINTGRGLWNMKEKDSWIIASPFVFKGNIYFGTSDSHKFYALDAKTGHLKWSIPLNMRVYGEAVSYDGDLFFGCFNGKLYKVNHIDGVMEQLYQTEGSKRNYYTIYKNDDKFRDDFELYGSDLEASEKKILRLGSIISTPVVDNGIIYFGDANGIFYALRIK